MTEENPKVPSNLLHALAHIKPSQLMDKQLWDFDLLESQDEICEDGGSEEENKACRVNNN